MRTWLCFLTSSLFALIVWGLASYDFSGGAYLSQCMAFFSSLIMLRFLWGTWVTTSHVFVTFLALYTLSGPYEVIFGSGMIPPFSPPFFVAEWLKDAASGLLGLSVAQLFVRSAFRLRDMPPDATTANRFLAYWLLFLASCGEFLNMQRAGGFSLLFAGKAIYQAAVSDVSLTIPSSTLALLAFAYWGLHMSASLASPPHRAPRRMRILVDNVIFVVLGIPLFTIHLVLGQRMELSSYVVALLLGYVYYRRIGRFPIKSALVLLGIYIVLAPLFGFRWAFPRWLTGQPINLPKETVQRLLLSSLNPAVNEFGGPFGNYSTMMQSGIGELRYGFTYLRDLTVAIPGFLYPGDKPPSTVYEFRDRFFPERATRSRIAGTAFSSLLEARMNFGVIGPFLVFFVYGWLLGLLEVLRYRSASPWIPPLYCSSALFSIAVHRSATGGMLSNYLWVASILVLVEIARQVWRRRWRNTPQRSFSSSPV